MTGLKTVQDAPQGLVTPSSGGLTLSPAILIQRVKDIEQVRREVMAENIHYYSLDPENTPNDKRKWSLGKAGAEILNLAFGLCAETSSETAFDDPTVSYSYNRRFKEWYDKPGGGKGFNWKEEEVTLKGRYEVKATCRIYNQFGSLITSASGSANSWESAFKGTLYADAKNPVLKRAEKRAYVAATLLATAASAMFTQDAEDQVSSVGGNNQSSDKGADKGSTKGGWLSDAQKRLVFAKGKKAGYDEAVVQEVQTTLDNMGKQRGKPYFDMVADEKPEAIPQVWDRAKAALESRKPAGAPEPPADSAPDGSEEDF